MVCVCTGRDAGVPLLHLAVPGEPEQDGLQPLAPGGGVDGELGRGPLAADGDAGDLRQGQVLLEGRPAGEDGDGAEVDGALLAAALLQLQAGLLPPAALVAGIHPGVGLEFNNDIMGSCKNKIRQLKCLIYFYLL